MLKVKGSFGSLKWRGTLSRFDVKPSASFISMSPQGSFSEFVGFLVHCINMAIMLTFPAAVVLLVPSMTPGKMLLVKLKLYVTETALWLRYLFCSQAIIHSLYFSMKSYVWHIKYYKCNKNYEDIHVLTLQRNSRPVWWCSKWYISYTEP